MAKQSAVSRPNLRERRRAAIQQEIGERAAELFESVGFQDTSVEDIASAVGVSLRTFYRHCPSKEEALVPLLRLGTQALVATMRERPADESLPHSARIALLAAARTSQETDLRRIVRVMMAEPALRSGWLSSVRATEEELAPMVAERLNWPIEDARAVAVAGALVSVTTASMEHWATRTDDPSLEDVVSHVFSGVEQALCPR
ncbi:TetR/AcrR family transcriptional regulator [Streptomyces sp. NPDC004237]|uniref:TetR/AcrR family transcriptional regulator n=1 Tax=Streptomyces sp. NPDC004237 TaxID=3154455 RepID=UPI0033B797BF